MHDCADGSIEEQIVRGGMLHLLDLYVRKYTFSEQFLATHIEYITEFNCLKYQKHLSRDFVMKYLYDKPSTDSENWVSIDDVNQYFKNQEERGIDL